MDWRRFLYYGDNLDVLRKKIKDDCRGGEAQKAMEGVDITYASIAVVMKRLRETFGEAVAKEIALDGVPKNMEAARALAHKKDDRVRKEFEKWAMLTFTNNIGIISYGNTLGGGLTTPPGRH